MNSDLDDLPVKLKIVLMGDSSVGKTSIIENYVKHKFRNYYEPTIAIDFYAKNIKYNHRTYKLQIWDSAGQERFKSLATNYLKNADCALIVLDTSEGQPSSYLKNQIQKWVLLFQEHSQEKGFSFVVGNKIDKQERSINQELAVKTAEVMGLSYVQVSARTGQNIEMLFNKIIEKFQTVYTQEEIRAYNSRPKIMSQRQLSIPESITKLHSVNVNEGRENRMPYRHRTDHPKSPILASITTSSYGDENKGRCNC